MSEKKKKDYENKSVNAVLFILFWVISLGFLQLSSWELWNSIYSFVAINLPPIFHRLWIAFVLHGMLIGLGLGLAQKAAIQALSPIRLKYWIRINVLLAVLLQAAQYLVIRYIDWRTYGDSSIYILGISIAYQIILALVQWWILRKHYRQASLWLLVLIPSIISAILGYTPDSLQNPIIAQTLISALVVLWMNRQSSSPEKAKNTAEAEARLADSLPDEDEAQTGRAEYQVADA